MPDTDLKLIIELVPSTVWYSSIYRYYKDSNNLQKWGEIKKELFAAEGKNCWICGKEGSRLEAHEFWKYDEKNNVQKLEAIHHLCGLCHKVKHIGLWLHTPNGERMLKKEGRTKEDVIDHFCGVNHCSREAFKKHEKEAFEIWNARSKHAWKQDWGLYDPAKNEQKQEKTTLDNY